MKTLLISAFCFPLSAFAAADSILAVPTNPPPQVVRYYNVQAVADPLSGWCNSVYAGECCYTGAVCGLTWTGSPSTNCIGYNVVSGRASNSYSATNFTTATNCLVPFPTAQRITIFTGGGEVIFCATNPPGNWFFQAHAMQDGRFTIDETPDLTAGMVSPATNALLMVVTNGVLFTKNETIPQ